MSIFPTGTVLFMVFLDIVATLTISMLLGVVVARAAGRGTLVGVLVGGLVPIAGPLVWMLVEGLRAPALVSVARVGTRTPGLLTAVGLLLAAGVLYVICTPFGWGEVHGGYHKYVLATDQSAADTWLGMFATLGTALLVFAGAGIVVVVTAWRRVAVIAILAGASWLALSVNGLVVFRALDGLSQTVSGASGGNAEVSANPGTGLWLIMVAGALTVAGGVRLAFLEPARRRTAPPPEQTSPQPAQAPSYWGQADAIGAASTADDYWNQPTSTWSAGGGNGGWDHGQGSR
jgi:hypothetical protein